MLDESWNMISRMRREHNRVDQKFAKVVEAFSHDRDVTIGGGKGFGSSALKVNGTIFAMMSSKNEFVVKLSRDRVDALVASGTGKGFEPRPGKFMKEWIVLPVDGVDWIALAKEARVRHYTAGGETRKINVRLLRLQPSLPWK
jgi:hypothetical protein